MFRRLGILTATYPIPVIAGWIVLAVAVGVLAPSLGNAVSNSHASYLPATANSNRAQAALSRAFPQTSSDSAVIVVTGQQTARERMVGTVSRYAAQSLHPRPSEITSDSATPALRQALDSRDGAATLVTLGWTQTDASSAIAPLRAYIATHRQPGVSARVTGNAAINGDYQAQIDKSTSVTTIATVVLVLIIMLVLFRSVVLPLVPLLTIGVSLLISMGVVATLAQKGMIVSQNTPIFMIVLLAGAGTDYCLFLASRYREELQNGAEPREAVVATVTHVGASIASSASTVIVGMAGMALAQFGLFNTTGPAVAVSVAITLAVGLTLTPALLALLGRYTFWPTRTLAPRPSRFWAPLAGRVTRRPLVAVGLLLLLLIPLNLSVLKTAQSFNFLSDLSPSVEARAGFASMQTHYGAGNALPQTLVIVAPSSLRNGAALDRLDHLTASLQRLPTAASVQGPTRPAGRPIPYHLSEQNPQIAAALDRYLSPDGRTAYLTIVSRSDPYGAAAATLLTESQRRATAAFPAAQIYSDGGSAVAADIATVTHDDLWRIALFVLGGILIILALLLRSVVAPLYLIVTVLFSFGATLGATTLVFQGLGGQSGLVYWVPMLMLTFLIGLGIDYNILLMSRVREEANKGGSYRAAVAHAVERTGGIITSCGLIMAGTFGTLTLASVSGLRELGFAVGVGILLDTFLVRSILVPAIVVLFGQVSWFPGRRLVSAAAAPALRPEGAEA